MVADGVGLITPEVRRSTQLDPFYQKIIKVGELPVTSSAKVSDYALLEAAYIIRNMLAGRDDILQAMVSSGVRVVVMAHNEYTTDMPEYHNLQPRVYLDGRSRGMSGRVCSCAEENLLAFTGDPYAGENILVHEFAHAVHMIGLMKTDPDFGTRLQSAYQNAISHGLWLDTYAGTNPIEYWAECSQDWFDCNQHDDALHNHVHTRDGLRQYDPTAARLCAEVYGDKLWRYQRPAARPPAEREHLAGFDPDTAPRFHWREVPITDKPHVVIETALGNIEVELDAKAAPITVRNFLHYVQARAYHRACPRRANRRLDKDLRNKKKWAWESKKTPIPEIRCL